MTRRASVKRKRHTGRIIWIIIAILLVLIAGFGWFCFHSVNSMYRNIYDNSQASMLCKAISHSQYITWCRYGG